MNCGKCLMPCLKDGRCAACKRRPDRCLCEYVTPKRRTK